VRGARCVSWVIAATVPQATRQPLSRREVRGARCVSRVMPRPCHRRRDSRCRGARCEARGAYPRSLPRPCHRRCDIAAEARAARREVRILGHCRGRATGDATSLPRRELRGARCVSGVIAATVPPATRQPLFRGARSGPEVCSRIIAATVPQAMRMPESREPRTSRLAHIAHRTSHLGPPTHREVPQRSVSSARDKTVIAPVASARGVTAICAKMRGNTAVRPLLNGMVRAA
jgi:hypothetical protein